MIRSRNKHIGSLQTVWVLRYNCFMKIDIAHLGKLANIPLSDNEKKLLKSQLEQTLVHVDRLKEIDTTKVQGTNEVNNLINVWREDEVKESLTQEEALKNAKNTHKGFFVVPAILEETE